MDRTGEATRRVVLLCGPPGAGKSTLARKLGLEVLDRDDPHWSSDHEFDRAMERVGRDPHAQAVVIRSGATRSARESAAALIHPTETRMLAVDEATCIKRIRKRRRTPPSVKQQVGAVRTWWRRYEHPMTDSGDQGGGSTFEGEGSKNAAPHNIPPRRSRSRRNGAGKRVQRPPALRGYGPTHRKLRRQLDPLVQTGGVKCWRCGKRIPPGPWHLGHDDNDRSKYRGPEHVACNTGAANKNRRRKSRKW